jgi:hypothetical protein
MATEPTPLTPEQVDAMLAHHGSPGVSYDFPALVAELRRLTLALRGLLHCPYCYGSGSYPTLTGFRDCDCRINAKLALGETSAAHEPKETT